VASIAMLEGIPVGPEDGARCGPSLRHLPISSTCWRRPGAGGERSVGQSAAGVHLSTQPAGMLHGRQLRSGQKMGLCVGKPRRAKEKWMVVTDGQVLLWEVYSSPHRPRNCLRKLFRALVEVFAESNRCLKSFSVYCAQSFDPENASEFDR
jgi:hypothetical protein